MDDQRVNTSVLKVLYKQHLVNRRHLIQRLKHSATGKKYAEFKQTTGSMVIHVGVHTNISM